MIFRVTMKTPDALNDAIAEYVTGRNLDDVSNEGKEVYWADDTEECKAAARKWFDNGESVTIEIDTVRRTAEVLRA